MNDSAQSVNAILKRVGVSQRMMSPVTPLLCDGGLRYTVSRWMVSNCDHRQQKNGVDAAGGLRKFLADSANGAIVDYFYDWVRFVALFLRSCIA